MKDLRSLCSSCRAAYLDAGYRLRLIPGRLKEPCDICGRSGWTFEMVEESRMLKACKYCGRVHARDYDCGRKPKRTKYTRTENEALRYTSAMNAKSREIKERQFFLCPICVRNGDMRMKRLETHHIIKLRIAPSLMLEDENLIALCEAHHEEAERGDISAALLQDLARQRDKGTPPGEVGPHF